MMWSRVYAGGDIPVPTSCHTLSLIGRQLFVIGGYSVPTYAGMTHCYDVGTSLFRVLGYFHSMFFLMMRAALPWDARVSCVCRVCSVCRV